MITDARRGLVENGVDPIDRRRQLKATRAAEEARHVTFAAAAVQFIGAHRDGWRNAKHAVQWERTIATYVNPIIGPMPVADITTADVRRVLTPIWAKKPETASRVRGRIEAVLGAQIALGNAAEPNVARWHNNLSAMLPPRSRMAPVKHHAALDWSEMPAFLTVLRSQNSMGALALEFLIFTAARSGEVRGARWDEIDRAGGIWEIPAERMKARKPHRVPLSIGALNVLDRVAAVRVGDMVFPGTREGQPLSDMTLTLLLRRMGRSVTAHGMRATFKTWASDKTAHPIEVIELSLAHAVGGRAEQAYQRGTWFERRRDLMTEWSKFCWPEGTTPPQKAPQGVSCRGNPAADRVLRRPNLAAPS